MTLEEWEQEKDRELDEKLAGLFRSVQPPMPRAGFVSRTVKAARQAHLPAGRVPLQRPWFAPLGWGAIAASLAYAVFFMLNDQRVAAQILASCVDVGVRAGLWLIQSVRVTSTVVELMATTGRVVAYAASTREAIAALITMAAVAALSLSMLHRLLRDKESTSW